MTCAVAADAAAEVDGDAADVDGDVAADGDDAADGAEVPPPACEHAAKTNPSVRAEPSSQILPDRCRESRME
jgi:hypothetical protein